MSFAQGFAEGFVPSFQAGIQRKEKRRDDTFKLMYTDFMDRRKKRDKFLSEDRNAVKKAKALTEGADVPEGAWIKAYEWIQAGLDDTTISDRLSTGTFSASEMPAGQVSKPSKQSPKPAGQIEQPAGTGDMTRSDTLTTQTQQALGGTPQISAQGQQRTPTGAMKPAPRAGGTRSDAKVKRSPGVKGSLERNLGDFGGLFKKTTQEDINKDALERLSGATGMSTEEIQQIYDTMPEPAVDVSMAPDYTAGIAKEDLPDHAQAVYNFENAQTQAEKLEAKKQLDAIREAKSFDSRLRAQEQGTGLQTGQMVKYRDPDTDEITATFATPAADGSGFVDREGNPIPSPMGLSEPEVDRLEDLRKDVSEDDAVEYRNKSDALVRMYRLGGQMGSLVEETPELTAPFSSGVVNLGQRLLAEGFAASDILSGASPSDIVQRITSGDGDVTITHEEADRLRGYKNAIQSGSIDERVRNAMGEKAYNIAVNKQLYDTNAALMAYSLGVAEGQEGRSLQEEERKMFMELAKGGIGSPEKFYQNMGQMMNNMRSGLENQSVRMNELNEKVTNFERDFGWSPEFTRVTPVQQYLDRISQEDPAFARYVSKFNQYVPDKPTLKEDMGQTRQAPAQQAPGQAQGVPPGVRSATNPEGHTIYLVDGVWVDEQGNPVQ